LAATPDIQGYMSALVDVDEVRSKVRGADAEAA
jgi:hypothetical protein